MPSIGLVIREIGIEIVREFPILYAAKGATHYITLVVGVHWCI